jgi:peptide/nickel transport system permease protein
VLRQTRLSLGTRMSSALREDPILVVSAGVCAVLVLLVLFGPLLAPYSPSQTGILNTNQGWSTAHWLGTDSLGRDILSRLLYGARPSLIGAALVVVFGASFGTFMAIVSAWYGRWLDATVMRFANILFAVPSILVAIVAVAVFHPGLTAPVIALALAYSPYFARVGRAIALQERNKPYIEASLLAGFSTRRICFFHLLPSLRPILVAQATVAFGFALLDLAAISFIGLGVQPPAAEWGLMVSDGRAALLNGYPQAALSAGAMIVLTVVAFVVLGERLSARTKRDV